jgi:hypothetical protein
MPCTSLDSTAYISVSQDDISNRSYLPTYTGGPIILGLIFLNMKDA